MRIILAVSVLLLSSCFSQEEARLPDENNNQDFLMTSRHPMKPKFRDDESAENCRKVIWNPYVVSFNFDMCSESHTELEFCGIERKIEVKYLWDQLENVKVFISPTFNDKHPKAFDKTINLISKQSGVKFKSSNNRSGSQVIIESYATKPNQKADISFEDLSKPCSRKGHIVHNPKHYPFWSLCLVEPHFPSGKTTLLRSNREIDVSTGLGGNVSLLAYHSLVNTKIHLPDRVSKEVVHTAPKTIQKTVALQKVRCLIPLGASPKLEKSLVTECLVRSPGLFGFSPSHGNTYSAFNSKNPRAKSLNVFRRNLDLKCIEQLYREH